MDNLDALGRLLKRTGENLDTALDRLAVDILTGKHTYSEPTEEEKLRDRLKAAWIKIKGQDHHITFVDNETMEAYVIEGEWYTPTWKLKEPLTKETLPYTFERWCTGFDF